MSRRVSHLHLPNYLFIPTLTNLKQEALGIPIKDLATGSRHRAVWSTTLTEILLEFLKTDKNFHIFIKNHPVTERTLRENFDLGRIRRKLSCDNLTKTSSGEDPVH